MAYDITQPTDTTKLRNLGTVIRPNWVAIQNADSTFKPNAINLGERNAVAPPIPNDPVALAQAYLLYSKQDAAGNPELFGISSSSNIVQLTRGAINIAAQGHTVLPGGLIMNWGTGTGTSAVVVFSRAFTTSAFSISVTSFNSSPTATATVSALSTTGATLKSTNVNALYYIAIGF